MKKELNYSTSEQCWNLEKKLKERGYNKTGDCYWAQIFKKENKTIILNRV